MSKERIQKRIDDLLKQREKFIERRNDWEANKLGAQIAGLRAQLKRASS